ncbi:serine/threonine-protein kinase [Allostreptomyces psammosilenae]|uniref:Serine/threonine protein kinase n=1 Tax=Allostreptomyces psammosilenae TaxID=1892865 RepID=A0A853A0Q9_9ACTN|nr:serine/threonine-protein kinase [Allostreptomyces psammosilenae]NYI07040.1 serine/threonine protein kinase [Allostreptomyces psammosilenae]
MRLRPGERVGPYTVLAELASGGMGCVYLARSPGGRTLAVKTLLAEGSDGTVAEADRRRFAREVALARRVRGAYTASVVDADAEAPLPWMATEYIAAPSLRDLVQACGPLPAPAVPWVAAGVAEALVSVHSAGLVHRDVKPSNVLLPADGPRVIDFGISQAADVTRTHAALGTIAFTAPEQARGETTTAASDVFSLGATLFYLAVGRSPYRDSGSGPAVEQLLRVARGELDLAGLPGELHPLIAPCLSLDPTARPTPRQVLDRCAADLAARPEAHGAADWLPPSWVEAIERYRERRTREADEARRRVDPAAVTRPVPPSPPTTALPVHEPTRRDHPAPRSGAVRDSGPVRDSGHGPVHDPTRRDRPVRRRAGRIRLVVAGAAVVVLALGGVGATALLRGWGGDDPYTVAPSEPLSFVPVSNTVAGACPTPAEPNSYTSHDGSYCATLSTGGSRLDVERLVDVRARHDEVGGWVVDLTVEAEDAPRLSALTAEVAGGPPPQQMAILLGDRLLSAPAVYSAISGGRLQISGTLDEQEARQLAYDLGAR